MKITTVLLCFLLVRACVCVHCVSGTLGPQELLFLLNLIKFLKSRMCLNDLWSRLKLRGQDFVWKTCLSLSLTPFVNMHCHQGQVPVYKSFNFVLNPIAHLKFEADLLYFFRGLWILCIQFLFYVHILFVYYILTSLFDVCILLA